jgi:hypothetical protein
LTASQQVTAGNPTLRGRVLDNIAGVASFEVRIDGGAFAPIALDADGKFSLTTSFALDGSADGAHTLENARQRCRRQCRPTDHGRPHTRHPGAR